jgi:hypothetical protein
MEEVSDTGPGVYSSPSTRAIEEDARDPRHTQLCPMIHTALSIGARVLMCGQEGDANARQENHESSGGRKIWRAVGGARSSHPNAWARAGTGTSICDWSMSHRSACGGRRLASQAQDAAHPGSRRSGSRGRSRDRSYALEGRRPRRNRLAAQRLRTLRLLSRRMGNALRGAAELRIFGERNVRAVLLGASGLSGTNSQKPLLCGCGPDLVRGRHHLQRIENDGGAAR